MPRAHWSLFSGRPVIEVVLRLAQGGGKVTRTLLADTGAGAIAAPFELLLDETDCLLCDGSIMQTVTLGGAYTNSYPLYLIRVEFRVSALTTTCSPLAFPIRPPISTASPASAS